MFSESLNTPSLRILYQKALELINEYRKDIIILETKIATAQVCNCRGQQEVTEMDNETIVNGLCRQWNTSKGQRFIALHTAFDICARIGAVATKVGMTPLEFIVTCEKDNPFTHNETELNAARAEAKMWRDKYDTMVKKLMGLTDKI